MSYISTPIPIDKGGTGSTTASAARTALAVPLNTNTMLLDGTQAMTANMSLGGFLINNLGTPSAGTDAANKNYVDAVGSGRDPKDACRAASTANLSNIATGAPNTLDGVTLAANDRVLLKNQTTASANGIYVVTTLGTGSNGTWTRATDANSTATVTNGLSTWVTEGTTLAASGWILTTDDPITVGTTSLTFVQNNGGSAYTADETSIHLSGSQFSIKSTWVGQTALTTLGTITTGTWTGTNIAVANGGTGSGTASGARSNLSAAPNSASYFVNASNGELGSGIVLSNGTGINSISGGSISVDTSVVVTITGSQTLTNKVLTTPTINGGVWNLTLLSKVASYTLVAADADKFVKFTISAGSQVATLPAASTVIGATFIIKSDKASTNDMSITPNGTDKIDNVNASVTVHPGDSYTLYATASGIWDIY